MPRYFISGHLDLTEEEFAQHYAPRINEIMNSSVVNSFIVGDARGADQLAQKFLAAHDDVLDVRVYHMLDKPRHCEADRFDCCGGYKTDEERDAAMTAASNFDIAWIRPGRENSGTAKNLARRKLKNKIAFMSEIKDLFALEKKIHDYFGYKEDWVKIPLDDQLDKYWMVLQKDSDGGKYVYSDIPFTEETIRDGDRIYGGFIYTQRFLPKFVYRTDDFTMASANTQTDGNKFLMIFDNAKECTDEKLRALYNEIW